VVADVLLTPLYALNGERRALRLVDPPDLAGYWGQDRLVPTASGAQVQAKLLMQAMVPFRPDLASLAAP